MVVAAGHRPCVGRHIGLNYKTPGQVARRWDWRGGFAFRRVRVTHIYRREDGAWKIVHRHADNPGSDIRMERP